MRTLSCLALLIALPALAADWPQYRGPNRDDRSAETGLLQQWPAGGPKLLWTYRDAGIGYSGVAVVGKRLYTLGGRGDSEFLIALDLSAVKDGGIAEAWSARVGPLFQVQPRMARASRAKKPSCSGGSARGIGTGRLRCSGCGANSAAPAGGLAFASAMTRLSRGRRRRRRGRVRQAARGSRGARGAGQGRRADRPQRPLA